MSAIISLLHATRGRPQKAVTAYKMWRERAGAWSADIEHIFSTDFDDETGAELYDLMIEQPPDHNWTITANANKGSSEAWNNAYKMSHGIWLVQVSDDMEPPEDWVRLILDRAFYLRWVPVPSVVVAVSDGFRKDKLMTTFICTRPYAEFKGEFLHPEFASMFSDDDATYRAYRDQRDGKCKVIDARDIVFLHRHHYHDKSVPMDETYMRQNADSAYQKGSALFTKRNPDANGKDRHLWK